MGKGGGWINNELENLTRACIYATEDAMTGINQTADRFKETLFESFKEIAPLTVSDKSYSGPTAKACREKFDKLTPYFQNFRITFRFSCLKSGRSDRGGDDVYVNRSTHL